MICVNNPSSKYKMKVNNCLNLLSRIMRVYSRYPWLPNSGLNNQNSYLISKPFLKGVRLIIAA